MKGFPEITQRLYEQQTTISLPVQKPIVSDIYVLKGPRRSNISQPVPKPLIQLPVSKPNIASMLRDIDDLGTEERSIKDIDDLGTEERSIKDIDDLGTIERMIRDIDDLGTEDRSLDPSTAADLILGKGDAVFDTPTLGNLSRNVMARRLIEDDPPPISDSMPDRAIGLLDRLYNPGLQATLGVTSDAPEGDFTFSSAVPVEKLADLYKENTLEDVLTRQEEKQGLDLLAMILNALRPQFTTESAGFEEICGGERFPPSTALRSDRFNNGGIVQGFFRGGSADRIRSAADNFSSNISGNVSGRDAQSDQRLADIDLSNYGGTRNPKQQTFELIKEIENMNPVEIAVGNFCRW